MLAEKCGLTPSMAARVLASVLGAVEQSLRDGEPVRIAGFGSFFTIDVAPRVGRNPRTGEAVNVPACRGVRFSAATTLKDEFKSGDS